MSIGYLVLLATLGSVVSLAGGLLLVSNQRLARVVARISGSFAAGALIAAVLFDLLPEALELSDDTHQALVWVGVGITLFFLLERRLRWFHHHHEHSGDKHEHRLPVMLIAGDTIHNAIDGVAIGLAFLASPPLAAVTTLAVALHELPQEIGDFGLLLKNGWDRRSVIMANVLSALATIVAAVVVYFIGERIETLVGPALALTSGMLLYIALSDIVPSIHEKHPSKKLIESTSLLFLMGILVVWGAVSLSHRYIHEESESDHSHEVDPSH